jgi:hypothetical protein
MQDDDLATEVGEPEDLPVRVLQRELRRRLSTGWKYFSSWRSFA